MRLGLVELLGDGILTASSIDHLHEALTRATREMGFDRFALSLEIGCSPDNSTSLLIHDYPASWADVYIGFNLAATDPVRRAAERSVLGFGWRNILDLVPMTEMERTTFETGRRHGLVDGFTVPRHLPGDVIGSCSFVTGLGKSIPHTMLIVAEMLSAMAIAGASPLWDRAQRQLLEHGGGPRSAPSARHPSLLSQLLFDDRGEPLISTHANKGQVRHRYYVSRSLVRNAGGPRGGGMRVPAKEIERLVLDRLCGLLSDPVSLFETVGARLPNGHDIGMIGQQGGVLVERLRDSRAAAVQLFLRDLISRIDIMPAEVRIQLNPSGLGKHLGIPIPSDASLQPIVVPAIVKRSGRAMRMMHDNGRAANEREPDSGLMSTIAKAHRWWSRLIDEPGLTISEIARAEGVTPSWITRVIRLAFLDPAIVARIVDGKAPPHIDTKRLTQSDAIPLSWTEQRRRLGISERR